MRILFFYFCSFAMITFMFSCKTSNLIEQKKAEAKNSVVDSLFQIDSNYQYKIRKDDKLTISVWGQDDLSVGSTYGIYNSNEVYGKWLMVDAEGNIELPNFGKFHAEGKSIVELREAVRANLKTLLVNPVVEVKVLNKQISLLGEFRNPQVINIDKEKNYLMPMIAVVGGFEKYADLKRVKIIRKVGDQTNIYIVDLSKRSDLQLQNLPLYPDDVIIANSKKYKMFDQRISIILPFTSVISSAAIVYGLLK